ncbi:UDP-glucose dehydrogenase family protein [Propylenella binzhouense]|uniref:UDP-glucose 6-dehydrogenase n=1 Tax=Propylenella binzhouense TaxID=2555902 RepID=A0A964WU23_9HYPH|nr:UDP-glucose/GDP-mannose dehydrogenase family protein [Propylenella binzhouense]MYZ48652.1 UDP-glucose/GDP-mannose dehydrogenase family protein [Propylenella binzhouense]
MKIVMIGAGYVGLVSGACFSDFGHEVVVVDKDEERVSRLEKGEIPIYEPGLEDLVARNRLAGRLSFSTSLPVAMDRAQAVFIAVGTPARRGDGFADLTYVYAAAEEIARAWTEPCVVVCKSTVPIGTNREVLRRIKAIRPDAAVEVASNPEFLREGSAIEDFKRPDRVVVGAESEAAKDAMRRLYRPLSLNETPILFTGLETAELIKYAANAFLATKITFINEIADLCEKVGANVQEVARGIGLDRRIGSKFLHAGPGYGGSCFPKDTLALLNTAKGAGAPVRIVETVVAVNEARKRAMAERILETLGPVEGRSIAVLGVTFKPNTDDMREAPSLAIIPALQAAGARVRAHDPEGMEEAARLLSDVEWCDGPYHAAEGSDALVIITEWDVYRALDLVRLRRLMKGSAFFDLRNIYKSPEVEAHGFRHFGVGIGRRREVDMAAADAA